MSTKRQPVLLRPVLVASLILANSSSLASEIESTQLASMSLEQLLNLEVFTSASLIPTQTAKAPGSAYRFSQKDFRRYGVRRLEDLLQFVPGLQINQSRKRDKSIWSRGLVQRNNNKMVLLVDGIRQQHLYYGHFSLGDDLALENIDKVEVILGAASSLYGANAFSGLISVTTKDFVAKSEVTLSAEAANNDRTKVTAFYNSEKLQAFGSYLNQDAPFDEHRTSFIGLPTEQPLAEEYSTLQLRIKPWDSLTLKLEHRQQEKPFLFIPSTQDAFIETEFTAVSAIYQQGNIDDGLIEIKAYYQWDDGKEYELEQTTGIEGYTEYQDAEIGGIALQGIQQIDNHTLAVGLSFDHEASKNTRYRRSYSFNTGFFSVPEEGDLLSDPGLHNDNYALFLQDVWRVNHSLELTLGVRYDDFSQFGNYVNYRAAVVYSADSHHVWKLLYGTAMRTPNFREYLKVLETPDFDAPVPDAEKLKSLEVGYNYTRQRWSFSSNVYFNDYEDSIQERPTPDMIDEYFDNIDGGLEAFGAEAQLSYRHESGWDAVATASYVDSSSNDYDELPYIASWMSSVVVGYQWSTDHRVGGALIYNDSRPDLNSYDQDRADSMVRVNLFSSGSLSETLSYEAGIDNLFDEENYDPAADFGGQYNHERSRREVWLKLQWKPRW